ncbi:MAG TPA: hypothetical protein VHL10_09515 [Nitrososphaera sp.]|jgi:hypothetical protein|nr:hypothetical protein [Nitrososphaera sp.]
MTKQQQAKADNLIVIARYAHKTNGKLNGNVSYLVRNGGGKQYCITLASNGNTACTIYQPEKKLDIPESCPSAKGGRKCYHVKAVQAKEQARGWQIPAGESLVRDDYRSEECEAEPVSEPAPVVEAEEIDEDAKLATWTAEELAKQKEAQTFFMAEAQKVDRERRMASAPLNGNRAFSLMR